MTYKKYDVFISHASEDKQKVAIPLARKLEMAGLNVWLDAQELRIGDRLRARINEGISRSRFGVVILSPSFFKKEWTIEELDAFMGMESSYQKCVLPVRYDITHEQVRLCHPTVANKLSVDIKDGLEYIANEIVQSVRAESNLVWSDSETVRPINFSGEQNTDDNRLPNLSGEWKFSGLKGLFLSLFHTATLTRRGEGEYEFYEKFMGGEGGGHGAISNDGIFNLNAANNVAGAYVGRFRLVGRKLTGSIESLKVPAVLSNISLARKL